MHTITWLLLLPFIDAFALGETLDYSPIGEFADDPETNVQSTERILEDDTPMDFENVRLDEKNPIYHFEEENKAENQNLQIIEDEIGGLDGVAERLDSSDRTTSGIRKRRLVGNRKECKVRSGYIYEGYSTDKLGIGRRSGERFSNDPGDDFIAALLVLYGKPKDKPKPNNNKKPPTGTSMTLLHYDTTIRARLARTTVIGIIENYNKPKIVNINEVLPREALITEFVTYMNGRKTDASLKDTMSSEFFPKSNSNGASVGTKRIDARDRDAISLSIFVPIDSTLKYKIVYEYLLERNEGLYSVPITIHTNMWIADLLVRWRIYEDRELTRLETPLMYGPKAPPKKNSDPMVCFVIKEVGVAEIIWEPTISEQKNVAKRLGEPQKNGIVGTIEVRYDLMRKFDIAGQVLIEDEYFVQYYSPPDEPPIVKYVVFIFDLSPPKKGLSIRKLRSIMTAILDELLPTDLFSFIVFNNGTSMVHQNHRPNQLVYEEPTKRTRNPEHKTDLLPTAAYKAEPNSIKITKDIVKNLTYGNTRNTYNALIKGFKAILEVLPRFPPLLAGLPQPKPVIVFFTTGQPGAGLSTDPTLILKMVTDQNRFAKATIYPIGYGSDPDVEFLQKLALITGGKAKHIYNSVDSVEQVIKFYRSIKTPVLQEVQFKYDRNQVILSTVAGQSAPTLDRGGELIVVGKLDPSFIHGSYFNVEVTARMRDGNLMCQRTFPAEELRRNTGGYEEILSETTPIIEKSSNVSANRCLPSSGTVERIWALKMLSELRKAKDLDLVSWRKPQLNRCDDARQPTTRMMDICLKLNYAMPSITNLIYNGSVIQKISTSPDKEDDTEVKALNDDFKKLGWYRVAKNRNGLVKRSITKNPEAEMYMYLSINAEEDSPNETQQCPRSLDGNPGVCRYIPNCRDGRLFFHLNTFDEFFCRIGAYAGVCCPK